MWKVEYYFSNSYHKNSRSSFEKGLYLFLKPLLSNENEKKIYAFADKIKNRPICHFSFNYKIPPEILNILIKIIEVFGLYWHFIYSCDQLSESLNETFVDSLIISFTTECFIV